VAKAWSFRFGQDHGEIRVPYVEHHHIQYRMICQDWSPIHCTSIKSIGRSEVRSDWGDPFLLLSVFSKLGHDRAASISTTDDGGAIYADSSLIPTAELPFTMLPFRPTATEYSFERDRGVPQHSTSPVEAWSATFAHDGDQIVISCKWIEGAL
jgi:hypothetical protein